MKGYLEDFKQAIIRSENFKLKIPEVFIDQSTNFINSDNIDKLQSVILDIGITSYGQLNQNCLPVHLNALDLVKELFQTDVYYTIGNVHQYEAPLFKSTEEELQRILLSNRINEANLHAWLTLPSLEIIDFTILTTYGISKNHDEYIGHVIAKKTNELVNGLTYTPMLIGTDFVLKSGLS